ncbi:ATP-binding cassette domain-containing protein [candidate division KSB1 bacterium]|nr:ATP-binding cassette domain-containing protein [candidate division KSB1 bacterium]
MKTLNIEHVHKSYGEVHAVNDLTLSVHEGQVFGLLGPNGAGKTTTIRMIMDIIKPDQGNIEILGATHSDKVRDLIGYLPEERGLYKKMLVSEVIQFFAEIKGVAKKRVQQRAHGWLDRMDLLEWRSKKVEELSRGMQQKLQFICTILHEPRLIILDEPFTGLDPINTNLLKNIILDLKGGGTTIIFSTHLMEQAEKLCEGICLIDEGMSVLQGSLADIKKRFGKNRVRMHYAGEATFLHDRSLVASHDNYGNYVELSLMENVTPQRLLERALQEVTIELFQVAEPSLNEIFINVVEKGGQA